MTWPVPETMFRQALPLHGSSLPRTETFNQLISVLERRGKSNEARELSEREAVEKRDLFGKEQTWQKLAGDRQSLGVTFLRHGDFAQAELLHRQALQIARKHWKDWHLADAQTCLSWTLVRAAADDPSSSQQSRLVKLLEAELLAKEAGQILFKDKTAEVRSRRAVLVCMVRLYEVFDRHAPDKGHRERASQWERRLETFDRESAEGKP